MDGSPGDLLGDADDRPVLARPDGAPDDEPGIPRQLPKAPLVILGVVVGTLLVMLTGKVATGDVGTGSVSTDGAREEAGQDETGQEVAHRDVQPAGEREVGRSASPLEPLTDELVGTDYLVRTVAAGFREDFSGLVDESEARCMAWVVLDQLGSERLWQLTEAMAEHAADPDSIDRDDPRLLDITEVEQLSQRMRPCVSPEAAERLDFG